MSEIDRRVSECRSIFDALATNYRIALADGRQRQWAKAAHSVIDLLEHETLPDPWLDWLSENH